MAEENYYLSSGGLGRNWNPCYICNKGGKPFSQTTNMVAFVDDKKAGKRIVKMYERFGLHAVLNEYSIKELNVFRVQVEIGVCKEHLPNLEKLMDLCDQNNRIDPAKIVKSLIV